MNSTSDPTRLSTERGQSYVRLVRLMHYPQGIRAYFLETPLVHSSMRVLDAGCGGGIVTLALREALLTQGFRLSYFHGFDLTPAMLELFRDSLRAQNIDDVRLCRPMSSNWRDFLVPGATTI
jgi:ubiquinone/menaquinone biosynthesis C-methylase UbiE